MYFLSKMVIFDCYVCLPEGSHYFFLSCQTSFWVYPVNSNSRWLCLTPQAFPPFLIVHEKLYEIGSESDALPENAAPWRLKVRERWLQRKEELESFGMFRDVLIWDVFFWILWFWMRTWFQDVYRLSIGDFSVCSSDKISRSRCTIQRVFFFLHFLKG